MPSAYLMGSAAAGGIATINSLGNLAGYVTGSVMGAINDKYTSLEPGLLLMAASLTLSATLIFVTQKQQKHDGTSSDPKAKAGER